jgi:signal transduction histidine kinase
VLSVATALLIAVFAVSILSESEPGELAVLYVLPVMLAGLELGTRGGAGAAAIAIVLLLVTSGDHSKLTPVGLAASSSVFVFAGVIAGRFSERMHAARTRQERLLASGTRLARLNNVDALPAVLAEELQFALDPTSLQVQLSGMPAIEMGTTADETIRVPISSHGIESGWALLGLPKGRNFSPEDRVIAAKLARQAGVAAENQRLLASERERAALHAELEHVHSRLDSHLRNVGRILASQEAERREIAHQLREQAAQAMAGVLLGLHALERELDQERTREKLEDVTDVVRSALSDLRQLALILRPPSLDDLGLATALEAIAEREESRGARRITLHCDGYPRDLAPEAEICLYHVVEDAIEALDGELTIKLNAIRDHGTLRIELRGHCVSGDEQLLDTLATARARVELTGGTLQVASHDTHTTEVVAELPLLCSAGRSR